MRPVTFGNTPPPTFSGLKITGSNLNLVKDLAEISSGIALHPHWNLTPWLSVEKNGIPTLRIAPRIGKFLAEDLKLVPTLNSAQKVAAQSGEVFYHLHPTEGLQLFPKIHLQQSSPEFFTDAEEAQQLLSAIAEEVLNKGKGFTIETPTDFSLLQHMIEAFHES